MTMQARAQIPAKHGRTLFSKARHKALFGGRGGGKSWAAATYIIIRFRSRPQPVCASFAPGNFRTRFAIPPKN